MGKIEKYSIDFKLEVVGKYERGTCGYKRLARTYGLSRDTVRDWCLNPRLHEITTMARKKKINNEEHDLEYYKTAALFGKRTQRISKRNLQNKVKKTRFENDSGLSGNSTAHEDTETLVKLQEFQSQHSIITGTMTVKHRRMHKS